MVDRSSADLRGADRARVFVARQIPDEAMMRLRAYAREMREKSEASEVRRVEKIA